MNNNLELIHSSAAPAPAIEAIKFSTPLSPARPAALPLPADRPAETDWERALLLLRNNWRLSGLFMLAIFGTGALCVALAAASYFWWDGAGGKLILIASVIYGAGCIGVTMLFNIPLNDALAAVRLGTPVRPHRTGQAR